ncbi:hypothetical protein N9H39_09275 [Gammaproteobacteria bacterium]|nr:hypothetical protein [Gammaproteobacteria bacterium]
MAMKPKIKEEKARKSGGSKLTRSETVTVRLDPKLRYLAELAARTQRRTLSSYIEWTIDGSLEEVSVVDYSTQGHATKTLQALKERLWAIDEVDRLINLALICPQLMDFEEQHQWKVISETEQFYCVDGEIIISFVKEHWAVIKKYVAGEISEEQWQDSKTDIYPWQGINRNE